ncbi:hypothetical protein RHSIM_Rhsim02G0250900 [Rhododendron simsii]|uniref:NLP1-9 GAF domain-containing protein n=1 Tax=Rhododendron simsii TaxID=118357 RepID=A0A834HA05_RHOSS|nr:hypothetical protein RHSIM_Rhsim02G0250900 [Rhododendron simsii]
MGMCREYNNSFYADAECAQELLGLPGRVFLNQLPESTPLVEHYTLKEYPQRDFALRCGIKSSCAVPVFKHSSHACVGVLEIVSQTFLGVPDRHDKSFLGQMYDIFQEVGLQCFDGYKHYELQIGDENIAFTTAFQELKTVLETVCKIHKLPLAMTWVPCSACNDLQRGQLLSEGVEFIRPRNRWRVENFIEVSKWSHLRKGVVAGMVVSSYNMLYCSDITKLSSVEYPFVPHARDCKFRGWFTICLQSSYTANYIYVLEFFLPRSYRDRDNSKKKNRSGKNRYRDNSWASLSLILGTMEENFRTFKLASGLELGDLLSVKVIDFLKGQELHSVQKIQAKGGGEMSQIHQLDQASLGAIHSGTNVVSEDQNYILPSLEALQNEEVTMQLDSSHQPPLDPPNNGQNDVIAERNIVIVTSSEERKRKTQREHKGTGVRIEVSLDGILKCAKLKRKGAAKKLQDNFADSIRHALQKLIIKEELGNSLVQFWAATKTSEGRTLLTTQFQPFALGSTYFWDARNQLCEYRMGMCREYNNSFYADAECAEELLGLPGRVFLNQLPESTPFVRHYTLNEYPQREFALLCGIGPSCAVPVFDHSSHTCVGVLEIVSRSALGVLRWHDKSFLGQMYDIFQEFGLLCFDEHKHYEMQIGDENEACAFQELKTVLETVCKIHKVPLAMTWVPCSACNDLLRGQLLSKGEYCGYPKLLLDMFVEVSKSCHLRKRGVAGTVLSPPYMLYCSDITQLSLAEYPLVPYARLCKLHGWFTICLQSSYTANDIYVLEFFLPTSNRFYDNSWTSLSLILGTMEENFSTFKLASGQKLGDLLSVEVMDFQNGEKLHFIQKIRGKDGGEMLQLGHLDQPPMDAISNGVNVISEAQNYNLPSLEPLQSGKVTMQLDSSDQLSIDHSINAENVITAEQNIIMDIATVLNDVWDLFDSYLEILVCGITSLPTTLLLLCTGEKHLCLGLPSLVISNDTVGEFLLGANCRIFKTLPTVVLRSHKCVAQTRQYACTLRSLLPTDQQLETGI